MMNIDQLIESEGLFRTEYPEGQSFVWRLLTLKEYRVFRGLRDSGTLTENSVYLEAFKRCYVGDSRLLNSGLPLGMLVSIGQLIMYLSGDCELDTLKGDIEIAREVYPSQSVNERMKQVIFTAFSSYTIEDVEAWTRPKLIRNFILSEHVLLARGLEYKPIDTDEIKHPDDIEEVGSAAPKGGVDTSQMDFRAAAAKQRRELGVWATQDAEELEAERGRSKKLTTEEAKRLDKITAIRR